LQIVGIRGDEPRRAVKIHGKIDAKNGVENYCPLWLDKVTKEQVGQFWQEQDFDLQLANHNGTTEFGNCDLCFLKGKKIKVNLLQQRPDLADWWIQQEVIASDLSKSDQALFSSRHSYQDLLDIALDKNAQVEDDYASLPCICSD
jgi:hypothetical protein